ncbi:hypothetical protein CSIM01_05205 [Colletotrichum simmondsii]|uniref:Uncharacterized protein n=1 Tax=Colletotrichum simmondsii TaxID=703756 RepID=A0A135SAY6_9PEZI|nr:hypothetical protein CSIM01_05205 [Colletotrichum simmondsii]
MMLLDVYGMWDSQSTARPGHRAGLEHTTGTLAEGQHGCCFCAITAMCTKDSTGKSCRFVRVCCTCKLFRLRSGGIPPSTPSPPVFTMEQRSRESPAPSRSGDAPNFCLIKLDLPGPAPGPFPSLVPRVEADLHSRRPAPPGRFFVSVRITNIFCSKSILRHAIVSYIRFSLRQGMDIRISTAQNRRWLPYVWEPPSQVQRVNKVTLPLPVTSGTDTMPLCTVNGHYADYAAKPDL